jgi:uncharacterized protein
LTHGDKTLGEDHSVQTPAAVKGRLRRFRVLLVLPIFYLLVLALMMLFEESLIFMPSKYPEGMWNPPGLAVEDAWFEADGLKLYGWYVDVPRPRAVVLIAHGNAGNVTHRYDFLRVFKALGASVMVFDYRGYGRSEGSPSEAGVLADARAARSWLAKRTEMAENEIVLCGESLGGGVQVDLAAKDGARGLILISTFDSLAGVAAYHYPWVPVRLLMRTRLDSLSKIAGYHGPLLQIHGQQDTIVPLALAQRLFDAAGEPKEWVVIERGDHNDPLNRTAIEAIDRFLGRLPGQPAVLRGQSIEQR